MDAPRRSRRTFVSALAVLAAVISAPAPAAADEKAEELFQDGLREMLEGHYETACPKLAESARIEPLAGTVFTLAECESKRGRIATAVRHYAGYLALYTAMPPEKQARQRGREKIAADQIAALTPEVPLLTLTLAPGVPEGTVVSRDGEALEKTSLGLREPVDPGEHVITVTPPGGRPVSSRVQLDRGENRSVVLSAEAAHTLPAEPPPAKTATPKDAPKPIDRAGARKIASLTTGGAGLVSIAVGGMFGALAWNEKRFIDAGCHSIGPGAESCSPGGKAAADRARDLAAFGTFGVVSGLGALAAAGVLYALATPAKTLSPTAGPAAKGAALTWSPFMTVTPEGRGAGSLGVTGTW